ncbi:hypothetical protein HDU91_004406, partial [Kappamyces sp. JEL0680]
RIKIGSFETLEAMYIFHLSFRIASYVVRRAQALQDLTQSPASSVGLIRASILLDYIDTSIGGHNLGTFYIASMRLLTTTAHNTPNKTKRIRNIDGWNQLLRPVRKYGIQLGSLLSLVLVILWSIFGVDNLSMYILYRRANILLMVVLAIVFQIPFCMYFGSESIRRIEELFEHIDLQPQRTDFGTNVGGSELRTNYPTGHTVGILTRKAKENIVKIKKFMLLLLVAFIYWCVQLVNAVWANEYFAGPHNGVLLWFKLFEGRR